MTYFISGSAFCAVFGPQCHEVIAFSTALRTSKALSCFFLLDISCDSTSSLLRESALQLRISKLQKPESVFGCNFKIAGMQLQYNITIYTHAVLIHFGSNTGHKFPCSLDHKHHHHVWNDSVSSNTPLPPGPNLLQ